MVSMVSPWPASCFLPVYYFTHFFLEERFLTAFRSGGLRWLWRDTRFLTLEFCFYYLGLMLLWASWMPDSALELRRLCWNDFDCFKFLRSSPDKAPVFWDLQKASDSFWELHPDYDRTQIARQVLDKAKRLWPIDFGDGLNFRDGADIQWRDFRDSLDILVPVIIALTLLVRGAIWLAAHRHSASTVALIARLMVGLAFAGYLHGVGLCFLLMLAISFFVVACCLAGTRLAVPAAWALALVAIFAKEENLPFRQHLRFSKILGEPFAFLDQGAYQGKFTWLSSVSLIVLRLLSFTLDCHAAKERSGYTFARCLSHSFYAPLWLAGPTIRFDDYLAQCLEMDVTKGEADQQQSKDDQERATGTHLGWYLLQLLLAFVFAEVGNQMLPTFSMARGGLFQQLSPKIGLWGGLLALNMMWLKFLVMWRLARAWALADGINPPENMTRGLNNHYSVKSFWQCWHASFNRWLLRYIYIPAGGKNNVAVATFLTFAFVAIWHEARIELFAWGALNAAFISAETVIVGLVRKRAGILEKTQPLLHRLLSGLGASTRIIMLMAVNLIGYSVGVNGFSGFLGHISRFRWELVETVVGAYIVLSCGAQLMFEVRRVEVSIEVTKKHTE